MNPLLAEWLGDVLDDEIIVSTENPVKEYDNTWAFTVPTDKGITITDMTNFIEQIINHKQAQTSAQMTLYSWFDEMSGQFKFSLSSLPKEKLPFKCKLSHVASVKEILALCLATTKPGIVPSDELEEISIEEVFQSEEESSYVLQVWSTVINE